MQSTATDGAIQTLSERLRESTKAMHEEAEKHPFQKAMMKGALSRADYAAYLGQMLLVHRGLEWQLRALCSRDSRVGAIVDEKQFQEPYLLEDLAALGRDAEAVVAHPSTAETQTSLESLASELPLSLLGAHYVLEGSNNGSAYVARAVAPSLRLTEGGTRYLDPYGEAQRSRWQSFKTAMDGAGFSESECRAVERGAALMFAAVIGISEDLWAHRTNGAERG